MSRRGGPHHEGHEDGSFANGLHANVCIVVPEWGVVIARTNGGREDGSANTPPEVDEVWNRFLRRLGKAIRPSPAPTGGAGS